MSTRYSGAASRSLIIGKHAVASRITHDSGPSSVRRGIPSSTVVALRWSNGVGTRMAALSFASVAARYTSSPVTQEPDKRRVNAGCAPHPALALPPDASRPV
jgi:hypothetical protein